MAENQDMASQFMVSTANKQSMLGRSSLNSELKVEYMQSVRQPGPRGLAP
jgi:hypothetical protein